MPKSHSMVSVVAVLTLMGLCSTAHAQWAVVDVGAIAQLVTQVATLKQQLLTAQGQLTQAQQHFQSITGSRGMERLLAGTVRNYLPPDWAALDRAVQQGGAQFGALALQVQAAINGNAIIDAARLAKLSPEERSQIEAARRSAAMLQVSTSQALQTTSSRFNAIQQLIDAIGGAQDEKAVLDLQARISAEQSMLQNEHTKLDLIYQAAQAQEWARRQQAREQAMVSFGSLRQLPPMGLAQ